MAARAPGAVKDKRQPRYSKEGKDLLVTRTDTHVKQHGQPSHEQCKANGLCMNFFLKGACAWGPECKFSHLLDKTVLRANVAAVAVVEEKLATAETKLATAEASLADVQQQLTSGKLVASRAALRDHGLAAILGEPVPSKLWGQVAKGPTLARTSRKHGDRSGVVGAGRDWRDHVPAQYGGPNGGLP